MKNLCLNGNEVCTSWISHRIYRAIFCELLLTITPKNKTKALAALKKEGELGIYNGLRICGITDLSFLQDFPLLLYLDIPFQKQVNTRHLDCLQNLRGLHLASPGAGIDFSCFPELEVFGGDWHVDNRNLDKNHEMRTLVLSHFNPRSRDLLDLANITRLEVLGITQTNITSLAGLETLKDLRYFDLAYAPNIESLEELASERSGIRELKLQNMKKIRSYQPIGSIKHLRRLMISNCAPMPNLKWTSGLKQLDFFSFVDTNIEDGNLATLLKLPKLKYVGTLDKKHYNYKSDDLNEILNQR